MIRTKIHFKENKVTDDLECLREITLRGTEKDLLSDIRAIAYALKAKVHKDYKSRVQYRNKINAIENAFAEGLRMTEDELTNVDEQYMGECLDEIMEALEDEDVDMEMLS